MTATNTALPTVQTFSTDIMKEVNITVLPNPTLKINTNVQSSL